MSVTPALDPQVTECQSSDAVMKRLDARLRDVGGHSVRRVLPYSGGQGVGPFVFFDHMGPLTFAPGQGTDVGPHPHIGLATVTYLFDGELVHKDSMGSLQAIRPGDVNWMMAGKGIAHSERTSPDARARGSRLHALQLWVGLPKAQEEMAPEFHHYAGASLPELELGGARLRVLAGSAYGHTSPVRTLSPLFYVDATLPAGKALEVPIEHEQRAAYVVEGDVSCGGERATAGQMLVFTSKCDAVLHAATPSRLVLLGGAPLDGKRHIWWNFVSSALERIEQAKHDWRTKQFPQVIGDDGYVPLPE